MWRFLSPITRQSTKIDTNKTRDNLSLHNLNTLNQAWATLSYEQRWARLRLVKWMTMGMMNRWLRMLLMMSRAVMVRICCQVTRCLLLPLISWLVASLGLLYLPSGQLHVGVPHPLLV